jgi:hypothetical protein
MAQGQRGEFSQQNEELAFFFLLIGLPIACIVGWFFLGKYVYYYERLALYWVLSFGGLLPSDIPVLGWITRQYTFFRYTAPKDVSYLDDALPDALVVNAILLLPIIFTVIRRHTYIGDKHPFSRFGRQLNLYDFMYDQFKEQPHLQVMWNLRLLSRPLDRGMFRMSDSAKSYAVNQQLVALPYAKGEPVIDEDKSRTAFRQQLGTLMPLPSDDPAQDAENLIEVLDNNEKAILASIVPRLAACDEDATDEVYNAGINASKALVKQYWAGYLRYKPQMPDEKKDNLDSPLNPPPPAVDTSGCDEVLREYLQHQIVRKSMLSHAYVRTFIYDAIQACRRVGKFPPGDLRWLMMLDRTFWLLISSAGRREPFWECAGIHAHYLYERKLGKPCERPMVEEAVFALVDDLENRFVYSVKEKDRMWASQDAATAKQAKTLGDEKQRKAALAAKAKEKEAAKK